MSHSDTQPGQNSADDQDRTEVDNPETISKQHKPELVEEVFSLFKGYLNSQLETKGKQIQVDK